MDDKRSYRDTLISYPAGKPGRLRRFKGVFEISVGVLLLLAMIFCMVHFSGTEFRWSPVLFLGALVFWGNFVIKGE